MQHMPRLEVSMHELPMKVNTGELHRVVLELYNPSKISVKVSSMRPTRALIRCLIWNRKVLIRSTFFIQVTSSFMLLLVLNIVVNSFAIYSK